MAKVQTIVSAVGEQESVLLEYIGRDSWTYNGRMRRGQLRGFGTILHVWFFEFDQIADEDVKQHMIQRRMIQDGGTEAEALEYLRSSTQAFPVAEVSLKVVRA